MIIWGWQRRLIDLGGHETRFCPRCAQEHLFRYALQYTCFRLYFIFGVVTSKHDLLLCTFCGQGWRLKAGEGVPSVRPSIPFMHRFGLLGLVTAVAILVGITVILR
ncbi:MAG TPA: hypothetical protein VFA04_21870 [Bryobacteraceae bacterium]|nr:hypothetical protein [Bryobacteraceae bacterium]